MHRASTVLIASVLLAACGGPLPAAVTTRSIDDLHIAADAALLESTEAVVAAIAPLLPTWEAGLISDAVPLDLCETADGDPLGEDWFQISGTVFLLADLSDGTTDSAALEDAVGLSLAQVPTGWADGTTLPIADDPTWRSPVAVRSDPTDTVAVGATFEEKDDGRAMIGITVMTACTDDPAPTLFDEAEAAGFTVEADGLLRAATHPADR